MSVIFVGRTSATLAALLLAGALAACSGSGGPDPVASPTAAPTAPSSSAPPPTHPFTGEKRGIGNKVLAVKVENTRPALPQYGLRAADIVYVEQVEGGETRMMAVYSTELPDRVGPVRSARISDLHILSQFGRPAFAYSGVQGKMKKYVRRSGVHAVHQENGGNVFYRAGSKPIPYNLYADPAKLLKKAGGASRTRGVGKARDIGFRFGPAPAGGKPAKRYTARWPSVSLTFTWSEDDGRWLSSYEGDPHRAAEGGRLGPTTVVVQYAKTTRSRFHDFLGNYTPLIETTGTGRAVVLRDGKSYDARWSRPSEDKGTTFTTAGGEPMTFAPGQVWVALVSAGGPRIP